MKTKEEIVAMLRAGQVAEFNQWRKENPTIPIDLSGVNLQRASLQKANLHGANLSWSNLSEADLTEADLSWSYLTEANLNETEIYKANFRWASGLSVEVREKIIAELKATWQ